MALSELEGRSLQSPPNLIVTVSDQRLGQIGYLVIDRTVNGSASGGIRFTPDVSIEELSSLAMAMTYKWAFLNVPMGGAKAGIFAVPEELNCERSELMEAFGRGMKAMVTQRVYFPGIDLGTTLDDLYAIMQGAGRPLVGEQIDGSYATALTVFETIRQVVKFSDRQVSGVRVALEGFGKVASRVAQLLDQAGARIVGVSTIEGMISSQDGLDVDKLINLKAEFGDHLVHHYPGAVVARAEDLYFLDVDLLIPGARPRVINEDNVDRVRASWIVPIANAPTTPGAEQRLAANGVLYIPDFVANCGGILSSAMRSYRFNLDDVEYLVSNAFARLVLAVLLESAQREKLFPEFVRAVAWRNHLRLCDPGAGSMAEKNGLLNLVEARDWQGIFNRISLRIHHKLPQAGGLIRRAALDRYADLTLGGIFELLDS